MRLYHSQCNIAARMPLVGVVHVAPVSRGLQGRMRRVEATYKPQRRSSLGSNHTADIPPPIGAAYLPLRRFLVTGGAAPMAREANMRRSLDADWCRDQYHKRKPLKVAINALHRISCRTAPPSNLVYSLINEAEQEGVRKRGGP
jgi:hypothetical protein